MPRYFEALEVEALFLSIEVGDASIECWYNKPCSITRCFEVLSYCLYLSKFA